MADKFKLAQPWLTLLARLILGVVLLAAAIPIIKLAVETKPSFEPSTAARSQFERFERCSIFRI